MKQLMMPAECDLGTKEFPVSIAKILMMPLATSREIPNGLAITDDANGVIFNQLYNDNEITIMVKDKYTGEVDTYRYIDGKLVDNIPAEFSKKIRGFSKKTVPNKIRGFSKKTKPSSVRNFSKEKNKYSMKQFSNNDFRRLDDNKYYIAYDKGYGSVEPGLQIKRLVEMGKLSKNTEILGNPNGYNSEEEANSDVLADPSLKKKVTIYIDGYPQI